MYKFSFKELFLLLVALLCVFAIGRNILHLLQGSITNIPLLIFSLILDISVLRYLIKRFKRKTPKKRK